MTQEKTRKIVWKRQVKYLSPVGVGLIAAMVNRQDLDPISHWTLLILSSAGVISLMLYASGNIIFRKDGDKAEGNT